MKTINSSYFTLDISEQRVREDHAKDLSGFVSLDDRLQKFADFYGNLVRNFLAMKGYIGSQTIRLLEAHGYSDNNVGFQYVDLVGNRFVWNPVGRWLEQHDGQYDILVLAICNYGRVSLLPRRKSLLVYALGLYHREILNEVTTGFHSKTMKLVEPQP